MGNHNNLFLYALIQYRNLKSKHRVVLEIFWNYRKCGPVDKMDLTDPSSKPYSAPKFTGGLGPGTVVRSHEKEPKSTGYAKEMTQSHLLFNGVHFAGDMKLPFHLSSWIFLR